MSLKAKLEAVIYAAEEPVTLAQLAALFQAEALVALPSATPTTDSDHAPETQTANESPVTEGAEIQPNDETSAAIAEAAVAAPEPPVVPGEQIVETVVDDEAARKQTARQRERQVRERLKQILDELMAEYEAGDRGMEIREIAGGYRMATKPEYHDAVRGFVKSLKPPLKLSLPALETLAVVAYKQPVTAPEVGEIRGVDSGGVLGSLISRKLIATAGRKPVIGRPILYRTTKEFLLRFGLKDLGDLPSMEEFEKMASELEELEEEDEQAVAPQEPASLPLDQAEGPAEQLSEENTVAEAATAAEPAAGN